MEQVNLLKQFVSISLKKPERYFVSYLLRFSSVCYLDVVLTTIHNGEYHFVVTKDLKAYCFKFARNSTTLSRVSFSPGQQVKKRLLQLHQMKYNAFENEVLISSLLKRKTFLKQQLENNIQKENYIKCAELHKLLVSVT